MKKTASRTSIGGWCWCIIWWQRWIETEIGSRCRALLFLLIILHALILGWLHFKLLSLSNNFHKQTRCEYFMSKWVSKFCFDWSVLSWICVIRKFMWSRIKGEKKFWVSNWNSLSQRCRRFCLCDFVQSLNKIALALCKIYYDTLIDGGSVHNHPFHTSYCELTYLLLIDECRLWERLRIGNVLFVPHFSIHARSLRIWIAA